MRKKKAVLKKSVVAKKKGPRKRPTTDLVAKTLTITSLVGFGKQEVISTYNWGNSSAYYFIISSEKSIKRELVAELKKFDENLANWLKKPRTKRVARLTTSGGTYFL